MLAAGADAFLGVGGARRIVRAGCLLAEENGHELVHARVGEEQVRRVGQERRRRHNGVLFLAKEIEKGLADFGGSHRDEFSVDRRIFMLAGASRGARCMWRLAEEPVARESSRRRDASPARESVRCLTITSCLRRASL